MAEDMSLLEATLAHASRSCASRSCASRRRGRSVKSARVAMADGIAVVRRHSDESRPNQNMVGRGDPAVPSDEGR
jgi:hypothetical protein